MIGEGLEIEGELSEEEENYFLQLFDSCNRNGMYVPFLKVNGKTYKLPRFWDAVARSRSMCLP